MADYTRKVKKLLSDNGCYRVRQGKGNHEIWYSPLTDKNVTVAGGIEKKSTANRTLIQAGVTQRV